MVVLEKWDRMQMGFEEVCGPGGGVPRAHRHKRFRAGGTVWQDMGLERATEKTKQPTDHRA